MVNFQRPSTQPPQLPPQPPEPNPASDFDYIEPAKVEITSPSSEAALLRQLLAAQQEQVLWSQRMAVELRNLSTKQRFRVSDLDLPFGSMVKLFVKAVFALIPAAIIVGIIVALVNVLAATALGLFLVASTRTPAVQPTPQLSPATTAAPESSAVGATQSTVGANALLTDSVVLLPKEICATYRTMTAEQWQTYSLTTIAGRRAINWHAWVADILPSDATTQSLVIQFDAPDATVVQTLSTLNVTPAIAATLSRNQPVFVNGHIKGAIMSDAGQCNIALEDVTLSSSPSPVA